MGIKTHQNWMKKFPPFQPLFVKNSNVMGFSKRDFRKEQKFQKQITINNPQTKSEKIPILTPLGLLFGEGVIAD